MKNLLKDKRKKRREFGSMPVEDKFKIVLQLQKLAAPILKERGMHKNIWETIQINQVMPAHPTEDQETNYVHLKITHSNACKDYLYAPLLKQVRAIYAVSGEKCDTFKLTLFKANK